MRPEQPRTQTLQTLNPCNSCRIRSHRRTAEPRLKPHRPRRWVGKKSHEITHRSPPTFGPSGTAFRESRPDGEPPTVAPRNPRLPPLTRTPRSLLRYSTPSNSSSSPRACSRSLLPRAPGKSGNPSVPGSEPYAQAWPPPNKSSPSPSAIPSPVLSPLPPEPQSS